ncbi:MAG TPA: DUF1080 domain-containing protein [Gemmata sp.]|nr:DUF1080 domain-containing protein [Gemmata sp.]
MRLSRLLMAAILFAGLNTAARADDTEEFLKPDNWEGRTDIWTLDAKAKTIVGETKQDPKYNTFFCSKKQYGDFELSFKVQLRDGVGNSGVQIRSELFDKDRFRVRGPQPDIGQQYWGSLYGENVGGMMQASDAEKVKKVVKQGEFNDFSIVAKGNHVTVKINGETMVDGDFPMTPDKKAMMAKGIIAFQAHAGFPKMRVEFKDIEFKDLSKK